MKKKTTNTFINACKKQLNAAGVEVDLQNVEWLTDEFGDKYAGEFDCDAPALRVAIGKPIEDWLGIFVHEFCHFEQWKENIPEWDASLKDDEEMLTLALSAFRGDIELDEATIDEYLHKTAILERDCEIRALQKIKEHDLPIDPAYYAKEANSYIALYYAMNTIKRWCEKSPRLVEEIMDRMPEVIEGIDHRALAHEMIDLYVHHCV